MKNDFLTIPDAPNYEINSQLICRNKKTGFILKPKLGHNGEKYYRVNFAPRKQSERSAKSFRRQAVAAAAQGKYEPVPSLNNLYEFCCYNNKLRNIRTKKEVPARGRGRAFTVSINKTFFYTSVTMLRWELLGEIPPRNSGVSKPCFLSKDNIQHYFNSRTEATKFLANTVFFSFSYIWQRIAKREENICGWHVNYLEDELPGTRDALVGAYYGPRGDRHD